MQYICSTLDGICSVPKPVESLCMYLADRFCPSSAAFQKHFTASINELSPTVRDQMGEDRKRKRLGRRTRYRKL